MNLILGTNLMSCREPYFTSKDAEYFKGKPIEKNYVFNEILSDIDINTIGPFKGTLYFAKLSNMKDEKEKYFYKDISSRRDTRDTFGGIKFIEIILE